MIVRSFAMMCGATAIAFAQPPAIGQNGVVNSASLLPSTLPNAAIARGARFEIVGVRLTSVGSPRVTIEHDGVSIVAPVRSAVRTEIEAVMPSNAPLGRSSLIVETEAGRSKPFVFEVAATRVGLYSRNRKGWGQGSVEVLADGARTPNSIGNPARPGQWIAILSTGLGVVHGGVRVVAGGKAAAAHVERNVEPGLDEIRFQIPLAAPEGCYVPVWVRVPNVPPSNAVTIAIASSGGTCRMPGGAVPPRAGPRLGAIGIGRATMLYADDRPRTTLDEAYGAFLELEKSEQESSPLLIAPPEGTCTTYAGSEENMPSFRSFPEALLGMLQGHGMTAGRALTLSDGQRTRLAPATGRGAYWVRLGLEEKGLASSRELFFEGTSYTLSGPGGKDVSEFSRQLSLVEAFNWRNEPQTSRIDRNRGVTVEWSSVSGANLMLILAMSADPLTTASAISLCSAMPQAGRMEIPKEDFAYFPKTQDIPGPPASLFFVVALRLENGAPPQVRGLDEFLKISSFTRGRRVIYH